MDDKIIHLGSKAGERYREAALLALYKKLSNYSRLSERRRDAIVNLREAALSWFGEESQEAIAGTLKLADCLFDLGEVKQASTLVETVVEDRGPSQAMAAAFCYSCIVEDLQEAGEFTLAQRVLETVIAYEETDELSLHILDRRRALVNVLASQRKYDAAEKLCRSDNKWKTPWSGLASTRESAWGDLRFTQGNYIEALQYYTRAHQQDWSCLGYASVQLRDGITRIAKTKYLMGQQDEAKALIYHNLIECEQNAEAGQFRSIVFLAAEELRRWGCYLEAMQLTERYAQLGSRRGGELHRTLSRAYLASGDSKRALSEALAARDADQREFEGCKMAIAIDLECAADAYWALGDVGAATASLEEAVSICILALGHASQKVSILRSRLAEI